MNRKIINVIVLRMMWMAV